MFWILPETFNITRQTCADAVLPNDDDAADGDGDGDGDDDGDDDGNEKRYAWIFLVKLSPVCSNWVENKKKPTTKMERTECMCASI